MSFFNSPSVRSVQRTSLKRNWCFFEQVIGLCRRKLANTWPKVSFYDNVAIIALMMPVENLIHSLKIRNYHNIKGLLLCKYWTFLTNHYCYCRVLMTISQIFWRNTFTTKLWVPYLDCLVILEQKRSSKYYWWS